MNNKIKLVLLIFLLLIASQAVAQQENKDKGKLILSSYIELGSALANDKFDEAVNAYKTLQTSVITSKEVTNPQLTKVFSLDTPTNLKELRDRFAGLSKAVISSIKAEEMPSDISQVHCPMANNSKGANWLQYGKEIRNPYFGSAMLRCGAIKN